MHTEKAAYTIGASRVSVWCEVLATFVGGNMGFSLKLGACSAAVSGREEVVRAPSMIRGTAQLKHWVVKAPSPYSPRGGGPTQIHVQVESLSRCPHLWFWVSQAPPKGVPVTPHPLRLDTALDITVMADRTPFWIVQEVLPALKLSTCWAGMDDLIPAIQRWTLRPEFRGGKSGRERELGRCESRNDH